MLYIAEEFMKSATLTTHELLVLGMKEHLVLAFDDNLLVTEKLGSSDDTPEGVDKKGDCVNDFSRKNAKSGLMGRNPEHLPITALATTKGNFSAHPTDGCMTYKLVNRAEEDHCSEWDGEHQEQWVVENVKNLLHCFTPEFRRRYYQWPMSVPTFTVQSEDSPPAPVAIDGESKGNGNIRRESSFRRHGSSRRSRSTPAVETIKPNEEGIASNRMINRSIDTAKCRCDVGSTLTERNPYPDTLPYDYNRVILPRLPCDENSHYINASYVNSWLREKAYVVTQAVRTKPMNVEFWRMVWELGSNCIVMLTKVFDFMRVIRTFRLTRKAGENLESRIVKHFHFTEWELDSFPYISAFIELRRRVRQYTDKNPVDAPIIVHCSRIRPHNGCVGGQADRTTPNRVVPPPMARRYFQMTYEPENGL
ncbi:Protein-tyrosine phosphatase [Teladorsagia circumcincta]|uniref:Protein-tyrosine phosphatase n=1 Tax=Teladorsagia circumcincta TaxID=45464 RepID=A0A2G9V206_TELCI|nr:Protein-tyrosine phosphatase [Teladorsagia circumcincta]